MAPPYVREESNSTAQTICDSFGVHSICFRGHANRNWPIKHEPRGKILLSRLWTRRRQFATRCGGAGDNQCHHVYSTRWNTWMVSTIASADRWGSRHIQVSRMAPWRVHKHTHTSDCVRPCKKGVHSLLYTRCANTPPAWAFSNEHEQCATFHYFRCA
jgi:hypothetical protein